MLFKLGGKERHESRFENMNLFIFTSSAHCSGRISLKFLSVFRRFIHSNPSFSPKDKPDFKWRIPQNSPNRVNVPPQSIPSDIYGCNVKITSLGRQGKVGQARKVFDEMPNRDIVSYAALITVYLKNGYLSNAEKVFKTMPGSSLVASSAMIDGYAKAKRMNEAREIFDTMPERNVVSWTSLISGYLRAGQTDVARQLFDQMPKKNEFSWTTMILGYARNGLIQEAKYLFGRMPEKNVVAWTSMIKCLVENGEIDEGKNLFDEMPSRNLYSWNIMLTAYLDDKRVSEAIELFGSMPLRNEVTWTTMVTGLARNGMTKDARDYFDQMPTKDITAWNAMITVYAEEGCMSEANDLFNLMPERNIVSWNTMIDGYSRHGSEHEALKMLISMLCIGDRPNETTITSVVSACESRMEIMQFHTLAILLGFESENSLANALITMYSRSGDITCSYNVFENLKLKDVVSWTAMILGYSIHGHGQRSLEVFARMLRSGVKPDAITFVGLLSACSHAGLLEKGKRLFHSMNRAYGLEPRPEHYSCLVDLLGRMGHVNEAVELVNQMPKDKRDGAVLGALLGACKLHGDIEVANQIATELIEMEPSSSGSYSLLANLYASCGQWDDFACVRKSMKEMKVKKVAGYSEIQVENRTHSFFSGDRSHLQMEEIRDMLHLNLLPQMRKMGYLEDANSLEADYFWCGVLSQKHGGSS